MSSPGIRPRNNQPTAAPGGKKGSQQTLRVLSEDGGARVAAPSIAMPQAKTELTDLLAGDDLLCVRGRTSSTATRQNAAMGSGVDAESQTELPATPAGQRGPDPSRRTHIADGDLAGVIDAWPSLPRNVRAAILAMIRETAASNA